MKTYLSPYYHNQLLTLQKWGKSFPDLCVDKLSSIGIDTLSSF